MSQILEARQNCRWCGDELAPYVRRDAKTCSKKCRQALHRFRVAPAASTASQPMRFRYLDPPYPGLARRYYDCEEVDHVQLIERAFVECPDGHALSTSAEALPDVLAIYRDLERFQRDTPRVCVWVRGARPSRAMTPRNAWEPLIVVGGRPRERAPSEMSEDVLVWGGRQHSHPDALVGMKSAAFCEWMFDQLGAARGDELENPFRGSGAVERAWSMFQAEPSRAAAIPSRLAGAQQRLQLLTQEAE